MEYKTEDLRKELQLLTAELNEKAMSAFMRDHMKALEMHNREHHIKLDSCAVAYIVAENLFNPESALYKEALSWYMEQDTATKQAIEGFSDAVAEKKRRDIVNKLAEGFFK